MVLQDQSLHMGQQVIDVIDVVDCPLKVLGVCLLGSWVVLNRLLGSPLPGEQQSHLLHASGEEWDQLFQVPGWGERVEDWQLSYWARPVFQCRSHWGLLSQGP